MFGKEVTATLAVFLSLFVCAERSDAAKRSSSPTLTDPQAVSSRAVKRREQLSLRFVRAKRDPVVPTMVTLYFEVVPERGFPVSALNPSLELVYGLSELWPIKGRFKTEWRKSRYDERKWLVRLDVYGTKPGVNELQHVSARLHYKGRPRGGDFRTAEFRFDKIPLQ